MLGDEASGLALGKGAPISRARLVGRESERGDPLLPQRKPQEGRGFCPLLPGEGTEVTLRPPQPTSCPGAGGRRQSQEELYRLHSSEEVTRREEVTRLGSACLPRGAAMADPKQGSWQQRAPQAQARTQPSPPIPATGSSYPTLPAHSPQKATSEGVSAHKAQPPFIERFLGASLAAHRYHLVLITPGREEPSLFYRPVTKARGTHSPGSRR